MLGHRLGQSTPLPGHQLLHSAWKSLKALGDLHKAEGEVANRLLVQPLLSHVHVPEPGCLHGLPRLMKDVSHHQLHVGPLGYDGLKLVLRDLQLFLEADTVGYVSGDAPGGRGLGLCPLQLLGQG